MNHIFLKNLSKLDIICMNIIRNKKRIYHYKNSEKLLTIIIL